MLVNVNNRAQRVGKDVTVGHPHVAMESSEGVVVHASRSGNCLRISTPNSSPIAQGTALPIWQTAERLSPTIL